MAKLAETLAKNLKFYREKRELSQVRLAKISRVSRATIRRYEEGRGEGSFETLGRLAVALMVQETDLTDPGVPPSPIQLEHDLEECIQRVTRAAKRRQTE